MNGCCMTGWKTREPLQEPYCSNRQYDPQVMLLRNVRTTHLMINEIMKFSILQWY